MALPFPPQVRREPHASDAAGFLPQLGPNSMTTNVANVNITNSSNAALFQQQMDRQTRLQQALLSNQFPGVAAGLDSMAGLSDLRQQQSLLGRQQRGLGDGKEVEDGEDNHEFRMAKARRLE